MLSMDAARPLLVFLDLDRAFPVRVLSTAAAGSHDLLLWPSAVCRCAKRRRAMRIRVEGAAPEKLPASDEPENSKFPATFKHFSNSFRVQILTPKA